MITIKPYQLDTRDTQWAVAHLYEHLVIDAFHELLHNEHGISEVYGSLNGQTFEERVFIHGGFYDPAIGAVFDTYMANLPSFTHRQIQHALAAMESEDRSFITITNNEQLVKEINRLRTRQWDVDLDKPNEPDSKQLLTYKASAKQFKRIIIEVHADSLTPIEQILFLRLNVMFIDVILRVLHARDSFYSMGNSDVAARNNKMAYMTMFTVRSGAFTNATIKKLCQDAIQSFDSDRYKNELQRHFDVFASEPLWQTAPADRFRDTGNAATNQQIAAAATPANIRSVFSKATVRVRNAKPVDYDFIG